MRITTVALALFALAPLGGCTGTGNVLHYQLRHEYGVHDPQFPLTMGSLLGPALLPGNKVDTLVNGDRFFPAMLDAIRAAKRSVNLETYIYWSDTIGAEFTDALVDRARAGVKCHVLIDALGSLKFNAKDVDRMKAAGVHFRRYNPPKWFDPGALLAVDHRTHRKLLIVDGRIGFTGGAGIADEWRGDADSPHHWRDTQFRIEGPAVAQLQAAFADNWVQETGQVLHGDDYFPKLAPAGDHWAQVFASSVRGGSESMLLMFLLSLTAAERDVRLAHSYFVPDATTIRALLEARKRGVRVRVLTVGKITDLPVVRRASRAKWGELLKAGVEIHEYQPTMYHCKTLIVDGLWVSTGSANMDNRSFRLNDEANLNVLDPKFAAEQERLFDADLAKSRRVTYEEWESRPLGEKLLEGAARLLEWQL
ncbi:MAG TPA: phospholipase D-like domain-containing protein [Tepidisphaeraceae bacterium]|nr:phospholipase D-like domain-containing protein [Tepidisphaeraceae bacterium]